MAMRPSGPRIFWIDGLAALSAGLFVLVFRTPLAGLYGLPLDLITSIGLVNVGYSAFGLTLAVLRRRRLAAIVGLAAANCVWAVICVSLATRYRNDAGVLGLAHLLFEAVFVAALGAIEWRTRRALAEDISP
jgi:hypothetical protein